MSTGIDLNSIINMMMVIMFIKVIAGSMSGKKPTQKLISSKPKLLNAGHIDTPKYLTQTLEDTGYAEKIDSAFRTRIKQLRS